MLFSTNNSLTLEQVMFELNRGSYSTRATAVDFATAAIVVDELVKRGHLHSKLIETESGKKKYLVRIFNSINWPIP